MTWGQAPCLGHYFNPRHNAWETNETNKTTHPHMTRNHSNILESWCKLQMMPYADFNVCWFQLCTHIRIAPICCLNGLVAKSHAWGDEGRTGNACSLNVEAFMKRKRKENPGPVCLFTPRLWICDSTSPHPVFVECMKIWHGYRWVISFGLFYLY